MRTARRHRGLSEAARTLPGPRGMLAFLAQQPFGSSSITRDRLHEHSQTARGPVGKVLCSEKDRNKAAKCWNSFSSAGKESRDSRRSFSSDSKTRVPCEGKEGEEGSLTESTQTTQECLQKRLWICLLEQWMLLVLGSCLHSREGPDPNTRTKEGLTSFVEDSLIGAKGTSYPSILSPREMLDKTV